MKDQCEERSQEKRHGDSTSKSRSKRNSRHIVLNKPVNVDDGGGVAELNACNEDEDERNDGVQRLYEHFALPRFPWRRKHGDLGFRSSK